MRNKGGAPNGERNGRCSGGNSEYPNHSLFKKNRLIKLNKVKWICEICGGKAVQVHHKDMCKYNHNIKNLQACCVKCHRLIHNGSVDEIVKESTYTEDELVRFVENMAWAQQ